MARSWIDPQFSTLTNEIGVYALCDLDNVPIYVGKTVSIKERGIIGRVRRHFTSARSDIIANLQLDVWELAYVRAWAEPDAAQVPELERRVHHEYRDTVLAGKLLPAPNNVEPLPEFQECRILMPQEIQRRKDPATRLVRQVRHIDHLLDVVVTRKDTADQRRALQAHLDRLTRRFEEFKAAAMPQPDEDENTD